MTENRKPEIIRYLQILCMVLIFTLTFSASVSASNFTGVRRASVNGSRGYYYFENGSVRKNFTGFARYKKNTYRIEKGKINFKANGIYSGWYVKKKGKTVVISRKTANAKKARWVVKKGKINFRYNGIYKWHGKKWVIRRGMVNTSLNGRYRYRGKTYKVKKGRVLSEVKTASSAKAASNGSTGTASAKKSTASVSSSGSSSAGSGYIGNSNTMKFHRPGCRYASRISASNRVDLSSVSRADIISMGYEPCKVCDP